VPHGARELALEATQPTSQSPQCHAKLVQRVGARPVRESICGFPRVHEQLESDGANAVVGWLIQNLGIELHERVGTRDAKSECRS
jgi:hypothetical protein